MEEVGIATVVIAIRAFEKHVEAMSLPRLVIAPYLLGQTLGTPGDREGQRAVLRVALDLLEEAEEAEAVHKICRT